MDNYMNWNLIVPKFQIYEICTLVVTFVRLYPISGPTYYNPIFTIYCACSCSPG